MGRVNLTNFTKTCSLYLHNEGIWLHGHLKLSKDTNNYPTDYSVVSHFLSDGRAGFWSGDYTIDGLNTKQIADWWNKLKNNLLTEEEIYKGTTFGKSETLHSVVAMALKEGLTGTPIEGDVHVHVVYSWGSNDLARYAEKIQRTLERANRNG